MIEQINLRFSLIRDLTQKLFVLVSDCVPNCKEKQSAVTMIDTALGLVSKAYEDHIKAQQPEPVVDSTEVVADAAISPTS